MGHPSINIMSNKSNEMILSPGEINHYMQLPFAYLQARANEEKVEWGFELEFFVESFQKGCRQFFGVNLNEMCFPIYDLQEPNRGFLNNFINWYLLTSGDNN